MSLNQSKLGESGAMLADNSEYCSVERVRCLLARKWYKKSLNS